MIGDLRYGQHPQRAMPIRSWPARGRVGGIIVVAVAVQRRYGSSAGGITDEELLRGLALDDAEFGELNEFIQIIVITGILE